VQNTGYWISRDVQMSQGNIDIDPDPDTFLTLTLPQDQNPDNNKTIDYEFENMSGEQWLVRTESIGGSIVGQTAIAHYISDATAEPYNPDTRTLTFTIEATLGNTDVNRAEVTRQYEAMQRVPP
jgi:hypothetical protein